MLRQLGKYQTLPTLHLFTFFLLICHFHHNKTHHNIDSLTFHLLPLCPLLAFHLSPGQIPSHGATLTSDFLGLNLVGKQRFLSQPSSIVGSEQTKWPQQPKSHNDRQLIQLLHLSQVPRDHALIFSQSSISLFHLFFLPLHPTLSLLYLRLSKCLHNMTPPNFFSDINRHVFIIQMEVCGRKAKPLKHFTFLALNRCWSVVFVCILFIVTSPWGLKTLWGQTHSFRDTSSISAFWSLLVHRGNSLAKTMIG